MFSMSNPESDGRNESLDMREHACGEIEREMA
jgi:hypothetical protein